MSTINHRQLIVQAAECELGKTDPNVYWRDVLGSKAKSPYPQHWCGAFALWSIHQADVARDVKWEIGRGFLYRLMTTKSPMPGDVGYIHTPYQHHFVVVSVDHDSKTVTSIDGNSNGTVVKHTRPLAKITSFYSIESLLAYP